MDLFIHSITIYLPSPVFIPVPRVSSFINPPKIPAADLLLVFQPPARATKEGQGCHSAGQRPVQAGGRVEGPLAPIQVSQKEAGRVHVPQPGTEAPENLSLVGVRLWLLKVRGRGEPGTSWKRVLEWDGAPSWPGMVLRCWDRLFREVVDFPSQAGAT